MIPDQEMSAVMHALEEAIAVALAGCLADGYARLLTGVRRAESHRAPGRRWAEELVQRYRATLDTYADRYGLRME